jgi:manganese/iron transport system permease protein
MSSSRIVAAEREVRLIDLILEPLRYAFMIRGLIAAVLVGTVCAVTGIYVVLRGMAFFGDALAHSILPGVAAGYLVNGGDRKYIFWWALLAAIISSLGIGAISRSTRIKEDTAIGIIFTGMFALGIAMISTMRSYTADLTHFLFGDVLGVSQYDLVLTGVFSALIILINIAFYKEFRLLAFDPTLALTLRLPARFLHYLQLTMMALVIVVSLQTVGVALMAAMLITPAATAFLLTKRLWIMMLLAAGFASFSGVSGLYVSYYLRVSSGAAIVLTATFLFLLALSFNSVFRNLRSGLPGQSE